ncbi:zinc-binding dehydrogenase [Acinetobacter sp. YIM 103518]|uniref:Zinc-binding dehydrogenase n=1 Tax=Acinetobacter faecalis TaxID=2665161 RepID=A0A6L6GDT9_9GAMM|nr:NADP-dependent oxidoreductase [Acinetobacter faecalis]MDY6458101.1 NADP-dependent oxidoreductase [Acinetobacter faecalis]MTD10822.1 zinc-binding dehydrogenase [Acinetobacter faecalis]
MKAIQFSQYGKANVLEIKDVKIPTINAGQILVQVKAFGINPIDWKLRSGAIKAFIPLPLPFILGSEVSGIVMKVSDDVKHIKVGDNVYGRTQHAYAEYVSMDADKTQIIPAFLNFAEAASLPSGSQVAYSALKTMGNIQKNQKVLIHAGAGGVGTAAIQIAKYFGAHVTTTVSTSNIHLAKQLGADEIIDYRATSITTLEKDFDLILDSVGGQTQIDSWDLLKENGTLVSLVSDESAQFSPALNKEFHFMRGVQGNPFEVVNQLISARKIKPTIDQVYDFNDIAAAHIKSETGHVSGKLVIVI